MSQCIVLGCLAILIVTCFAIARDQQPSTDSPSPIAYRGGAYRLDFMRRSDGHAQFLLHAGDRKTFRVANDFSIECGARKTQGRFDSEVCEQVGE